MGGYDRNVRQRKNTEDSGFRQSEQNRKKVTRESEGHSGVRKTHWGGPYCPHLTSLTCTPRTVSVHLPMDNKRTKSRATNLGSLSLSAALGFPILKNERKMDSNLKAVKRIKRHNA